MQEVKFILASALLEQLQKISHKDGGTFPLSFINEDNRMQILTVSSLFDKLNAGWIIASTVRSKFEQMGKNFW